MWTRKEVKEQGKAAFKANYWKSVIVAFIISVLIGGGAGVSSYTNAVNSGTHVGTNDSDIEISGYPDDVTISINGEQVTLSGSDELTEEMIDTLEDYGVTVSVDGNEVTITNIDEAMKPVATGAVVGAAIAGFFAFLIVFAVVMAVVLAFEAFIVNPLYVGGMRFFVKNHEEPAGVSNLGYGFDNNYRNVVITMILRDIYTILWSLLFIIPGIVKAYEYRMIPYLLADDPTMTKDQAFAISKQMMTGNKWKAFVLDLSFIGWYLLSLITLGIVGIFYVAPYKNSTDAALYRKLLVLNGTDDTAQIPDYTAEYAEQAVYAEAQETENNNEL